MIISLSKIFLKGTDKESYHNTYLYLISLISDFRLMSENCKYPAINMTNNEIINAFLAF